MATNPLRDGFREVLNDPALLLIEIAWRWSFGVIAFFVCAAAGILLLGRINTDPHRFQGLVALGPWQLAQVLAESVAAIRFTLLRVSVAVGLILSLCWIVLSSAGRHATLARPALAPGATLRACFAISAARAGVTLAGIIAWIAAGMFAGLVSVSASDAAMPNFALITAILLPALILIVAVWVTANWYLSLAPLLREETWIGSMASAWNWSRLHRDQLFEISIAVTAVRVILLVVALMLSFAVSAVVTNLRVVAADLLAITLLYFLIGDFLYVVKLAAYAKLKQSEKVDLRGLDKATDLPVPVSDSFQSLR